MGGHLAALKVLLFGNEFDWRWRSGYVHLQKPLLHVDGIPFTEKDHKCINITRLEFHNIHCIFAFNWILLKPHSCRSMFYIHSKHTMALTVDALRRECSNIGAPEVAPWATLYRNLWLASFTFWCSFYGVILTDRLQNHLNPQLFAKIRSAPFIT